MMSSNKATKDEQDGTSGPNGSVLGDVPALLRQLRLRAELTQVDAAEKLGVSSALISRYEAGEVQVSVAKLEELLSVYGVESLAELADVVSPSSRAEDVARAFPGRSAEYYREMADLLERLERLERIVARDR